MCDSQRRRATWRSGYRLAIVLALACNAVAGRLRAQTPRLQAEQFKNLGVAYLEEKHPAEAERAFRRVIELAGDEALGYANLGVALMRLGELEAATSQLEQARRVAPNNVEVLLLGAETEYTAGHWGAAIRLAQRVLQIDRRNAMARYYIYRASMADRNSEQRRQSASQQIELLYRDHPDNLVVAIRYARLKAEQRDWPTVASTLDAIEPATAGVSPAQKLLASARELLANPNRDRIRQLLTAMENALRPTARFRRDLFQLQPPVAGLPLLRFSKEFYAGLDRERPRDVPVKFTRVEDDSLPNAAAIGVEVTRVSFDFADVNGDGRDDWLIGFVGRKDSQTEQAVGENAGGVQLWETRQGKWIDALSHLDLSPAIQARFVDLDNDGQYEIVAVGPAGTILLQRNVEGRWEERSAQWQLKPSPGQALELLDADNEGDLDLCIAGAESFQLWRNRPDGTLGDVSQATGLSAIGGGAEQVVGTDHDDDLDTDLVVLTAGGIVQLWDNQRHGKFARKPCGLIDIDCRCLLLRDVDNNGYEDLVAVTRDGKLIIQQNQDGSFAAPVTIPMGLVLFDTIVDLDFNNDGWVDLIAAGSLERKLRLSRLSNTGRGTWDEQMLPPAEGPKRLCRGLGVVDYDRDGDQDLVAIDQLGRIVTSRNDGGNANHWLRVQLTGLRIAGSKNNLHGIGSKIEIKAGLFYEMQYVRRPATHFGLGTRSQADLMRVVWGNGVPQNLFHPTADQTVREVQVLKGSCPYLYCWNGQEFVFVTDTLAGAPLGLQVAEGVLAPDNPRELLTIAADKIAPHSDAYVFQYTSELWETVYLDQVALWVVDHPVGSDVFTDQRFLPPPYGEPKPVFTRRHRAPQLATDTAGRNVTGRLLKFDHRYPEQLTPTRYQGLVEPHSLTLQFGDVTEFAHPVLLIGCWIFWTDTSINVAVSQDPDCEFQPTALEVWDPDSGWHALDEPFGLPSGKDKWIVLDVAEHIDRRDARIRLRSGSEIHWDQAFLADWTPEIAHRITKLAPREADLHYGGFHQLYRPAADGPHLYRYGRKTDVPLWMTMTGMATRYGDVTELLSGADDRFVIFTGGDEVTVQFGARELPELPAGWQRSFLFYSDGWEKDSDRNTVLGETVNPLPFHGMSAYPYPPSESYPDDPEHREYLRRYQTRHIGPQAFQKFVREYRSSAQPTLPWDSEPGVLGEHIK